MDNYKDFNSVHGNEPSDIDVPSKNTNKPAQHKDLPKAPFPLAYTRARMILTCTECDIPRLLYAKYAAEHNRITEIKEYFEEKLFICGCFLDSFPEFFQNPKLMCFNPVSLHYYQAGPSLAGFRDVCAICLDQSSLLAVDKLMLCKTCYAQKNPHSEAPNALKQRRSRGRPKKTDTDN